jgi:hypothetical protein
VVSWDIKQTLQMSHNLRQENKEQKDIRHSIFQALIHRATYLNASGHNHQSNWWLNTCPERKKECERRRTNWSIRKIDELINNIPKKISTVKEKHVTPNENTQPTAQPAKEVAIGDRPISVQMPIPRVQKNTNIKIAAISPWNPRVHSKSKEDILPKQMNLRLRIQEATQARLPHRHNMQLRQQEQREPVQLIQDDKMGEYLNYW